MVNIEFAIQQFLAIAQQVQMSSPLSAATVMDRLAEFYRDVRVVDADLEADGDMFLLQWGSTQAFVLAEPTDLRRAEDAQLKVEDVRRQYLDFTRQVFAPADDEDAEFDDSAVQLSMTLVYGLATGQEQNSNLWIHRPDQIEAGFRRFRSNPLVSSLLSVPAGRLVATAGFCG